MLHKPGIRYLSIGLVNDNDVYATWAEDNGQLHYWQCPKFNKAKRRATALLNVF